MAKIKAAACPPFSAPVSRDVGHYEDDDAEPPAPDESYLFGWDSHAEMAWRPELADDAEPEHTKEVQVPHGAKELDSCIAIFADGSKHLIAQLTVGQWQARVKAKTAAHTSSPPLYEEGGYTLRMKPGRIKLFFIAFQCKQILQLRLDWFLTEAEGVTVMSKMVDIIVDTGGPI